MFGKKNQHTFANDMRIQLFLSFHFYLLYLLLNSCERSGVTLCSWNSPREMEWSVPLI